VDRVQQLDVAKRLREELDGPAFIARTVIGTSAWPVMKITGSATPVFTSSSWKAKPRHALQAHVEHQAAGCIRALAGEEFARRGEQPDVEPAEAMRLPSASRIEGSSSMTNTTARFSPITSPPFLARACA
jgi:hypothetical protein